MRCTSGRRATTITAGRETKLTRSHTRLPTRPHPTRPPPRPMADTLTLRALRRTRIDHASRAGARDGGARTPRVSARDHAAILHALARSRNGRDPHLTVRGNAAAGGGD